MGGRKGRKSTETEKNTIAPKSRGSDVCAKWREEKCTFSFSEEKVMVPIIVDRPIDQKRKNSLWIRYGR
jgi:hypothetical protein